MIASEEKIVDSLGLEVEEEGEGKVLEVVVDQNLTIPIIMLPILSKTEDIVEGESKEDETGLVVWSAGVVLARYLVEEKDQLLIKIQSVCELGAGCGFLSKVILTLLPQVLSFFLDYF